MRHHLVYYSLQIQTQTQLPIHKTSWTVVRTGSVTSWTRDKRRRRIQSGCGHTDTACKRGFDWEIQRCFLFMYFGTHHCQILHVPSQVSIGMMEQQEWPQPQCMRTNKGNHVYKDQRKDIERVSEWIVFMDRSYNSWKSNDNNNNNITNSNSNNRDIMSTIVLYCIVLCWCVYMFVCCLRVAGRRGRRAASHQVPKAVSHTDSMCLGTKDKDWWQDPHYSRQDNLQTSRSARKEGYEVPQEWQHLDTAGCHH